MFAKIIVDIIHSNVAHPFTYLVPGNLQPAVGSRVVVPFGPRRVDGYVIGLGDQPPEDVPPEKIRSVVRILDPYPALLPQLIALAEEISLEAHCPLSESIRLMLPAGLRTGTVHQKTAWYTRLMPGVDAAAEAEKLRRAPKQAMLMRLLVDGSEKELSVLSQLVTDPREALKTLAAKQLVILEEREVFRLPEGTQSVEKTFSPPLTPDQRAALGIMLPALERGEGAFLLHGVTGSGKTEVYLNMVEAALNAGKGAIILVPEIALTPQMVRWFCSRFGNRTAVLHSRLTDGQRFDEWRRIRLGQAHVVVGARSAVFAPVENLGLIVIDEEHEQTYLSDKHPRYDARRIAVSRCKREGASLILSSATPSILSFAMARRGDYTLVEMPKRVNDRPLPEVTIVDMRRELECGNRSIFSSLLIEKMKNCLDAGHQAMLFLNRRGYNTFVSCRKCGYVVKCEQCDLSMTLHRNPFDENDQELRCHMCGAVMKPPVKCPECGSPHIRYFGSGTQRVEEEMHKLFPDVPTVRMDIDTTRERNAHARLLERFSTGEARVLIGTQMIAKGLDFPKVTLVGVVAADMTLNLPDYRAAERTFQLITQVAGRAGRAQTPGEVVVQTYKPEDLCITTACRQDYRAFFDMEFRRRRAGLYPPFTLLTRLLVESPDEETAKGMTEQLYSTVTAYLAAHPVQKKRVLMIRRDEAPVKRIRGQFRYHVLLKVFDHADVQPLLALMSELTDVTDDSCHVYCEVNPATLM